VANADANFDSDFRKLVGGSLSKWHIRNLTTACGSWPVLAPVTGLVTKVGVTWACKRPVDSARSVSSNAAQVSALLGSAADLGDRRPPSG